MAAHLIEITGRDPRITFLYVARVLVDVIVIRYVFNGFLLFTPCLTLLIIIAQEIADSELHLRQT